MFNFNLPYAATSLRDFWRRWHISLSTWLRDYLYISLGGNRRGSVRTYLNLVVTMLLGGLWHGAAWNFVLWGAWHGGGLALERALTSKRAAHASGLEVGSSLSGRNSRRWWAYVLTLGFVFYGWLLFRAGSLDQIVAMTRGLGSLSAPVWLRSYVIDLAAFALPLVAMEVWQHRRGVLAPLRLPGWGVGGLEGLLLVGILVFWEKDNVPFIYFQF
jgi:D-alanyl-lipoteichoic acid acyltransferase DltB (MBOAT superfamily)